MVGQNDIKVNHTTAKTLKSCHSFRIKGLEMIAESFPQFVINLFMIQALQLSEPLNIFSCTISGWFHLHP